jgi:hypothetical protein
MAEADGVKQGIFHKSGFLDSGSVFCATA